MLTEDVLAVERHLFSLTIRIVDVLSFALSSRRAFERIVLVETVGHWRKVSAVRWSFQYVVNCWLVG